MQRALLERTPGGASKWELIRAAGTPELVAGVYMQRAGIAAQPAGQRIAALQANGRIPEPLRVALAQINSTVGDIQGNADKIRAKGVRQWAAETMRSRLGSTASEAQIAWWTELMGATDQRAALGSSTALVSRSGSSRTRAASSG